MEQLAGVAVAFAIVVAIVDVNAVVANAHVNVIRILESKSKTKLFCFQNPLKRREKSQQETH